MAASDRAFVAGATGYTGRELVRAAVAAGLETIAHVRPDSLRLAQWRARFEGDDATIDTTAWEAAAMRATMERLRPTLVFALLGTTTARGRRAPTGTAETYDSVDYGLTVLLLEAATPCRPRFVYLSAAMVGPRSPGAYASARWRVEEAIRASGLSHVIARPSFITGPDRDERRIGERLGAAVSDAGLAMAGALGARRLRDRYRSTTNVALARALVRLAVDRDTGDGVFQSEQLR